MIDIKNATVFRNSTKVFDDFSLHIDSGEKIAVLGPNGAGKSTLLKLLTRELYPVVKPNSHLKLFGEEHIDAAALRQRMGMISQDLQDDYTPYTTGLQVVLSGFFASIGQYAHLQPSDQQQSKAFEVMRRLGMQDYQQVMYQQLSTGQKRRLLVARALVHEPATLIFDEPCNGLDMHAAHDLLQLMRRLSDAQRTLVLTTHHVDEIIPEIERVALLKNGRLVDDGAKQDVLTSAKLSALFEVDVRVEQADGWYRLWWD